MTLLASNKSSMSDVGSNVQAQLHRNTNYDSLGIPGISNRISQHPSTDTMEFRKSRKKTDSASGDDIVLVSSFF